MVVELDRSGNQLVTTRAHLDGQQQQRDSPGHLATDRRRRLCARGGGGAEDHSLHRSSIVEEKRMSTRSVAVNGKSGPVGMPETKQACRSLAKKRQDRGAGWQPLRSVTRVLAAGLLALGIASGA